MMGSSRFKGRELTHTFMHTCTHTLTVMRHILAPVFTVPIHVKTLTVSSYKGYRFNKYLQGLVNREEHMHGMYIV